MDAKKLQTRAYFTTQRWHQKTKSSFSVMLFDLFGNKSLVDICIRYPVCSAEQPASILKKFGQAWEDAKDDAELQTARQRSQPNEDLRLSKQIYGLNQVAERARGLRKWIAEDWNNWHQLSDWDKELLQKYDHEDIRGQIKELRAQQQPRFQGAASSIVRNMTTRIE